MLELNEFTYKVPVILKVLLFNFVQNLVEGLIVKGVPCLDFGYLLVYGFVSQIYLCFLLGLRLLVYGILVVGSSRRKAVFDSTLDVFLKLDGLIFDISVELLVLGNMAERILTLRL